jgi:hypothetical protein
MHWHSFQITILVHICYWWNPTSTQKKLLTKYHHYIYDDNEHDTLFVQQHFKLQWAHLTFGCSHNAMSQKGCQTIVKTINIFTYVHMVPFKCNHNNDKLCLVTNTYVEKFKLNCHLFHISICYEYKTFEVGPILCSIISNFLRGL